MERQLVYIVKYEECFNNLYYSGIMSPYRNLEDAKITLNSKMYELINEYLISLEQVELHDNKFIIDLGDDYVIYEIIERVVI